MRKNVVVAVLVAGIMTCAVTVSAAQPSVSQLIAKVRSGDEQARKEALVELIARASEASDAVPALVECLKADSGDVRALAVECLGDIGAPARSAVPALVALVGDPDAKVRREVIEAVRDIGPGRGVFLPLLAKELRDADPAARIRALDALANQGKDAVPGLIDALKEKQAAYWACLVISEIGPDAKETVPGLIKLLDDPRADVRREAVLALGAIGEGAAPAIPDLVKALNDPVNNIPATYALGMIGQLPAEAEAVIEKNANSSDAILATLSAWTLARAHPDDARRMRRAVRLLIVQLTDKNPAVRTAAAKGLLALKPDPETVRPLWERALQNADEATIVSALDAMAGLGAPVVPRLIAALKYEKMRPYAASILGRIGPPAKEAAEPLAGLLDDKDPDVRREALFALAKIGPDAKAAVPALVKALKKHEPSDCYAICYALGSIGPGAAEAEGALEAMLDKEDDSLCLFSAWALCRINPECEATCTKAMPALVRSLGDAHADFRVHAAEALGRLGPRAKDALPALRKALSDKDERVRQAAAEAIRAIGG